MWSLLPRYHQAIIVVALGVLGSWALAAIITWWTGTETQPYQAISLVVSIILFAIAPIFEKIWRPIWRRFPSLNRVFFPDLNGTWRGELVTTWKDREGKSLDPIPVTVWIRQGLFSVSITLHSPESQSHSVRCILEADRVAAISRVWYTYDNRPKAEVSHRSARHDGTAWLEINPEINLDQLTGQYFTTRQTCGDIRLERISPDIVSDI